MRAVADRIFFHAHGHSRLGNSRSDRRYAACYRPVQPVRLQFESVYAGFLGSADQIDCVRDAVLRLKSENGTAFIDPVMGDNGEVYATYTPEMCTRMRELCEIADIITPNTTEAAILLDRDPASAPQNETEAQGGCMHFTAATAHRLC